MSVEFIGYIGTNLSSEIIPNRGPIIDRDHVETVAKAHDDGGFDRALVAFGSTSPESQLVVAHAASVTKKLGFMIAHRPGFTAPTVAARQLATLDQFTGGRIAVHIITGGSDDEMRKDGDHLTKDERYARTDEYLDIVRLEWSSEKPFDYYGNYYQVEQAFGSVKPYRNNHLPVYFGGSSEAAIPVAGKHADIYALWGSACPCARSPPIRRRRPGSGRTRSPNAPAPCAPPPA
jgi:alkanesulfonate monooxygenase